MKKGRIAIIVFSLMMVLTLAFAIDMPALAASNVVESDWITAPQKQLVKCPGGTCDHTGCDYVYSFAVVGDTQSLNFLDVTLGTENMSVLYRWLVENKEKYNIEYVMGVGDITESFNADYTMNRPDVFEYPNGAYSTYDAEWENAKNSVAILDGTSVNGKVISIPYSLVLGNHDNTAGFNGTFGVGNPYYIALSELSKTEDGVDALGNTRYMAGFFDETKIEDTYRKVEFGGHKYIIFTLRRYPSANSGVMQWISDTLESNPEYSAIVTLHQFLNNDSTILDQCDTSYPPNAPYERMLWENCLKYHENVSMIICGHVEVDDILTTQLRGDKGNTVTCMLVDGQEVDMVVEPSGMVAMLYFSADGKVVNVEYISTIRDAANKTAEVTSPAYLKQINQFALDLDYSSAENDGWTKTPYGYIPTEIYSSATFHVLLDDDSDIDTVPFLFGSFDEWEEVLTAIHANNGIGYFASREAKTYYVVMTDDYTDTHGAIHQNEAGKNPGKLILDLSGFKFSIAEGVLLPFYNNNSGLTPEYTIKCGTVNITGGARIAVTQSTVQGNGGTVNLNLTDLDIIYGASGTGSIISYFTGKGTGGYVNVNVTDCDIDSSASTKSVTFFNLKDTNNINHVCMNIKGGSFKGSTAAATTVAVTNELNDKITFLKDADGNYPTLTLSDSDNVSGVFYSEDEGTCLSYGSPLESNGKYVYTLGKATVEMTDYGMLDIVSYPVDKFPFVVFKNGSVIHAFSDWKTFINTDLGKNSELCSGCTLYLRKNYVTGTDSTGSPSALYKIKDMTLDLGNNVLTSTTYHLFQAIGRNDQGNSKTAIKIINGTLKGETKYSPISFNDNANSTAIESFDFVLENVILDVSSGISLVRCYGDGTVGAKNSVTLNNCTIYRDSANKSVTIFSLNYTNSIIDVDVVINGGSLVASSMDGITFAKFDSTEKDTLRFDENFKIVLPASVTPTAKYTLTDGTFCVAKESINTDSTANYKLYDVEKLSTDYGDIDVKYASVLDNPFVVFKDGAVVYTFSDWYKFMNTDINNSDYSYLRSGCTVLLRSDYTTSNASGKASNMYRISDITFDLGGNTLTAGSKHLFQAIGKATSEHSTSVKITNGTLCSESGGYAPIVFNDNNSSTVVEKFNFILENVTLDVSVGIGIVRCYGDGTNGAKNSVILNNCTIYRNSENKNVTLFPLSETKNILNIDVIVNGGKLLASSMSGITFGTYNSGNDTLTFGKDNNGSFTVVLPENQSGPTGNHSTVDGVECVFVKASENNGYVNYSLYPEVMIGYKIKTSVTLYSNFVYNIYVPKANLNGFTVNGSAMDYEEIDIDGVAYYLVKVELPVAESLSDIKLTVTLNSGDVTVDASWTLSVFKYTKSVLAGEYNDTTKTLMKDMLVYASCAHTYFEKIAGVEAKLSEINTLLNGYTKELPTGEAKKPTNDTYFTNVAVYLGEVPSFRFYLAESYTDSDFTFNVGSRSVTATLGNDDDGDYLEIVMYAYMMLDDVTYTVKGTDVTESYNLFAYYAYAKTLNNDNLVAIVEGLMKYSVSAEAYRDSVVNK